AGHPFSGTHTSPPVPAPCNCRRWLRCGQTNPLQSAFLSPAAKVPVSCLWALGRFCPNANYTHFSLFRPRQCNGTDTSRLHAGTRLHAKFDYGCLVFFHSL